MLVVVANWVVAISAGVTPVSFTGSVEIVCLEADGPEPSIQYKRSHSPDPIFERLPHMILAETPLVLSTSPNTPAFKKLSSDSSKEAFANGPA